MGFFRGVSLIFFSILLFVCILAQGFFLTFYFSLNYDSIGSGVSSVASDITQIHIIQEEILERQAIIEEHCNDNLEFVFSSPSTNQAITIHCEDFSKDSNAIIQNQISEIFEKKYYQSYDCAFFDCIQKTQDPFSLVSKQAQNYWRSKFFYSLILFFIFATMIFLLVRHKSNSFLIYSSMFILSSFLFLKLELIFSSALNLFFKVENMVGEFSLSSILNLFLLFLNESFIVFALFLSIGILFLIVGILTKIFGWSFRISEWFERKKELRNKEDTRFSSKSISTNSKKSSKVNKKKSK